MTTTTWTLERYLAEAGLSEVPESLKGIDMPEELYGEPFSVMPHQITALNYALRYSRFGLYDEPGCVSGDTEFLTTEGWKRMDQYQEGDLVMQYDDRDGTARWCAPSEYIVKEAPYLISIKGSRGTDQLLSPDHRVLLKTNFSNKRRDGDRWRVGTKVVSAKDLLSTKPNRANSRIPVTFSYSGAPNEFLTDEQLRVMVAVIADGHFPNKCNTVILRLKRARKIERIRELLDSAGIEYLDVDCKPPGFRRISFTAPIKDKEFDEKYWGLGLNQLAVVFDEFPHWDGSAEKDGRGPSFSSISKKSADFIQYACAATGHAASVGITVNEHHPSGLYYVKVRGTSENFVMPRPEGITRVDRYSKVYCFTVPTGFLVLRRNGYIFITGNCAKTLPAMAYALVNAAFKNRVLMVMPPILVWQLNDAFDMFFPGVRERFKFHTLNVGAYPERIMKKKAQAIRRDISAGKMQLGQIAQQHKVTTDDVKRIRGMSRIEAIRFTQNEIMLLRQDKRRISDVAARFGCSGGAVSKVRNTEYREDLFADWNLNGWPDIMMMTNARFNEVSHLVTPRYKSLVVDEAHSLCNQDSQIHRKVFDFATHNEAKHGDVGLLLMTGTPAPNGVPDYFGLIRLTNPKAYSGESNFRNLHLDTIQIEMDNPKHSARKIKFEKIVGYRNLDLLHQTLYASARRIRKEDVFSMARPRIIRPRLELSDDHKALYEQIVRDRILNLNDAEFFDLSVQQKLRMAAAQAAVCPEAVSPEYTGMNNVKDFLLELLKDIGIGKGEKIVIFAHFVDTINVVAKTWLKDFNPAVVNSTTNAEREVQRFLRDEQCTVMLAHPLSGGVGLNFQHVCRYGLFLEPTSVPGRFTQAAERIYRKGQKRLVSIYLPEVLDTVLPKAIASMLGKSQIIAQVQQDRTGFLEELLGG